MSGRIVDLTGNADDIVYAYLQDAELGLVDLLSRYASDGNAISRQSHVLTVTGPDGAVMHQFAIEAEFGEYEPMGPPQPTHDR